MATQLAEKMNRRSANRITGGENAVKSVTKLTIPSRKGNFVFLTISSRTEDTYPKLYNNGHISPIAMHIPHSKNESESFSLGNVIATIGIDVTVSAQSQDCLDFISAESLIA